MKLVIINTNQCTLKSVVNCVCYSLDLDSVYRKVFFANTVNKQQRNHTEPSERLYWETIQLKMHHIY